MKRQRCSSLDLKALPGIVVMDQNSSLSELGGLHSDISFSNVENQIQREYLEISKRKMTHHI